MATNRNYPQYWIPSVFNEIFDNNWMIRANSTAPSVNVLEDDKAFKVEVAAPGMTKDDFSIRLNENGDLVINMEKKVTSEEGDKDKPAKKYLRREFSYTKFQQTLALPDNVEKEKISASVKDGILSIELPKFAEEPKPANRFIEIQ